MPIEQLRHASCVDGRFSLLKSVAKVVSPERDAMRGSLAQRVQYGHMGQSLIDQNRASLGEWPITCLRRSLLVPTNEDTRFGTSRKAFELRKISSSRTESRWSYRTFGTS
jgi:hypothetical protein